MGSGRESEFSSGAFRVGMRFPHGDDGRRATRDVGGCAGGRDRALTLGAIEFLDHKEIIYQNELLDDETAL